MVVMKCQITSNDHYGFEVVEVELSSLARRCLRAIREEVAAFSRQLGGLQSVDVALPPGSAVVAVNAGDGDWSLEGWAINGKHGLPAPEGATDIECLRIYPDGDVYVVLGVKHAAAYVESEHPLPSQAFME